MKAGTAVLRLKDTSRQRGVGGAAFRLEVPSFRVERGEAVAVTGPSGSGKSTLLDLLGLVLRPDRAGEFAFQWDGGEASDVAELWQRRDDGQLARLRSRRIGYLLQSGGLLPFLDVARNIQLSRRLLRLPVEDPLLHELGERLRIGHLLARKPGSLSVGERQRVAIARALAHRPALLLADEPTAALDPRQSAEVMELLLGLVEKLGVTAVIVTHEADLVQRFGLRSVKAEVALGANGSVTRFSC